MNHSCLQSPRSLSYWQFSVYWVIYTKTKNNRIGIKMSFIARYVYTYEEFVFVTEASTVQQNDSDKTQLIKRIIKKNRTSK